MSLKTLLAAGLLAIAGAQAQTIDAQAWIRPYTYELTALRPGEATWLEFNGDGLDLLTELCAPGIVCPGDRYIRFPAHHLTQHLELGNSWSEGSFVGELGGTHLTTHLEPGADSLRGSFANYTLYDVLRFNLSPYSELRIGYHIGTDVVPDLAPRVPYSATGVVELSLEIYQGPVGNARAEAASIDHLPAYSDEEGFFTVRNEYGGPLALWLKTAVHIDTAIPAVPEPATYWLLLSGLGLVALAGRIRRTGRIMTLAAATFAAGPLTAQAQQLDGALQLGATHVSWDGAPPELVDWKYVTLYGGICVPETDCHYEYASRIDAPETLEHELVERGQWTRQAFLGDALGASAALHLDLQAPVTTRVSSAVGKRLVYRLEPGASISLSIPVSGWVQPSGSEFDYELWAYFVLENLYGETDRAEAISTGGNRASVEDTLSITIGNSHPWVDFATILVWGGMEAVVTVVPEPPPLAMITAGLLILPVARRIQVRRTALNAPGVSP